MFHHIKRLLQLGSFVIFVVQFERSIRKISHPTSSTAISYVSETEFQPPSFTLCKAPMNHKLLFAKESEETLSNFDPEDFDDLIVSAYISMDISDEDYLKYDLKVPALAAEMGFNYTELWTESFTPWSSMRLIVKCETFNFPVKLTPNPFIFITFKLNLTGELSALVKVNDPGQMITVADKQLGSDSITIAKSDTVLRFQVMRTIVENFSWKDHACNEEGSAKFSSCINDYMYDKMGCSPIWDINEREREKCAMTQQDYQNLMEVAGFLVRSSLADIKNVSGCINNCKYTRHHIEYRNEIPKYVDNSSVDTFTEVLFMMPHQTVRKEKEVAGYDLNSFIGDVGGFLGLLLGLSVLDIYDIIFCFCQEQYKLFSLYKRKNKKIMEAESIC